VGAPTLKQSNALPGKGWTPAGRAPTPEGYTMTATIRRHVHRLRTLITAARPSVRRHVAATLALIDAEVAA